MTLAIGLVSGLSSSPGDDAAPVMGSRSQAESILAGPQATVVRVDLEPGWVVPPVPSADGAAHIGSELVPDAPEGSATVGAMVSVVDGSNMVIVHGSGARRLAYRLGGEQTWSDWQVLALTADEGPDGLPGDEASASDGLSIASTGPIWLDDDVTDIEFAVMGGDTSSFELTFIGRAEADPVGLPEIDPAGAVIAEVGSVEVAPPIIGRDQWASGEWDYSKDACDEGPSVADHLQAVVIHHTVTSNSYRESDVDDLLRAIHYSHVVINGWCDIGYNFVVDRFGRIWEARTGSLDAAVIGGHARGFNTSTVGIALLGQHQPGAQPTAAAPSAAAQLAVEALAHWKLGIHGVDPAGRTWLRNRSSSEPQRLAGLSWHYVPTILGHRDLGVTSCPGGHSMDLVRALPASLAAQRDLSLPYSFVNWQAHSHGPGFVVADASGGIRPAGTATPWSQAPTGLSSEGPAIAVGGNLSGGYLLSATGQVLGYGAAPDIVNRPAGDSAVVDLAVRSDGQSGWVLDATGALRGFGGSPDISPGGAIAEPVAVAVDDDGRGYVVDRSGQLYPLGSAVAASIEPALADGARAVDLDVGPDGSGWVLDDRGRVHGFGGAPSSAIEVSAALAQPVRAIAAAGNGPGGWVLDADGQLWPYGGARLVFPVSTDARADHAIDVANVGSVYSPAFVNGDDARYIGAIYGLFLNREPSIVETDLEVTRLEQGAERFDLTSALARSEAWSADTVDEMYRNALGREPDVDGRAYWLAEIGAGLRLQDLGTYFYGSQEYAARAGSNEGYVTQLYDTLLGRAPDSEGLSYWVGVLESRQGTPPDVANSFYASIESRRDRATRLSQRILDQAPSADSRDYWAERLAAVGDVDTAAEMAASSSYYRLAVDGPEP